MSEKNMINTESTDELHAWWNSLEVQWKKAFNESLLMKGPVEDIPGDIDLKELFDCPNFRFAGPTAQFPNLSFELTNLSGLEKMHQAEGIMITYHKINNIDPILGCSNLNSLFLNNNELSNLQGLATFKKLNFLDVSYNNIDSIKELESLGDLKIVNVCSNQLKTFEGLNIKNTIKLEQFTGLPNDNIEVSEVERVRGDLGVKIRRG